MTELRVVILCAGPKRNGDFITVEALKDFVRRNPQRKLEYDEERQQITEVIPVPPGSPLDMEPF